MSASTDAAPASSTNAPSVIICGTVQVRSHLMCPPLQATVTQVTQIVMANSAYGETTCDQMVSSDLLAR